MVKMKARGSRASVNTSTPITQVIPMTTTRDMAAFIQCLFSVNVKKIRKIHTYICGGGRAYVCVGVSVCFANLIFMALDKWTCLLRWRHMITIAMTKNPTFTCTHTHTHTHTGRGHHSTQSMSEYADQYDEDNWSYEGPDEIGGISQPACLLIAIVVPTIRISENQAQRDTHSHVDQGTHCQGAGGGGRYL